MMQCDRCRQPIGEGEHHEHLGQVLCEDCYFDVLSPAKACDPWAVHSAKTFAREQGGRVHLTEMQNKILALLEESCGIQPHALAAKLQITTADLDRELAVLRHMEKIRGELREGQRYVRLW